MVLLIYLQVDNNEKSDIKARLLEKCAHTGVRLVGVSSFQYLQDATSTGWTKELATVILFGLKEWYGIGLYRLDNTVQYKEQNDFMQFSLATTRRES